MESRKCIRVLTTGAKKRSMQRNKRVSFFYLHLFAKLLRRMGYLPSIYFLSISVGKCYG